MITNGAFNVLQFGFGILFKDKLSFVGHGALVFADALAAGEAVGDAEVEDVVDVIFVVVVALGDVGGGDKVDGGYVGEEYLEVVVEEGLTDGDAGDIIVVLHYGLWGQGVGVDEFVYRGDVNLVGIEYVCQFTVAVPCT